MNCDLMLYEHTAPCDDPNHAEALKRRAAGASQWGKISRLCDVGGPRDFLDGKPIPCGTMLELQAVEYQADDYGEYMLYSDNSVAVRYEADLSVPEGRSRLHAVIGGHEFLAGCEPWMRFRWE
jgi:hypothetical protein